MIKKRMAHAAPASPNGAVAEADPVKIRRRPRKTAKKEPEEVRIDYPRDGEIITSPHYSYRVGVSCDPARVEVSVNGGDWQSCREALGLWWFDWHGYGPGAHVISARAEKKDGQFAISAPRRFRVEF